MHSRGYCLPKWWWCCGGQKQNHLNIHLASSRICIARCSHCVSKLVGATGSWGSGSEGRHGAAEDREVWVEADFFAKLRGHAHLLGERGHLWGEVGVVSGAMGGSDLGWGSASRGVVGEGGRAEGERMRKVR